MDIFNLYNGEIQLTFNPRNHQYRVVNRGRKYRVPSVTRVTGIVDKSGPLIAWAVNNTIASIRGALASGREFSDTFLEEVFEVAKRSSSGIKKEAGSIGSEAHKWIEEFTKRVSAPDPPYDPEGWPPENSILLPPDGTPVRSCVDDFLQWFQGRKIEFIERERPVYSRRHRFSGRLDGIARVDDVLTLVDYKTSNGVYPEYVLQIGAYAGAYQEETGARLEKAIILRLGKSDGEFEAHEFSASELRRAYGGFLAALQLFRALERFKKRLK